MDAAFIVPSRGRPDNAFRLAGQWAKTTTAETQLVFALDDDDPELKRYIKKLNPVTTNNSRVKIIVGERKRLGGTLNALAPQWADKVKAVGFMGDDHMPRTPGWDAQFLATLKQWPGAIIYGNDLLQGRNLPTAVMMDSRVIQGLGWMVPPGLVHMYMDNFWRDFGYSLGTLKYLDDVIIEHVHPVAGKTAWDERYVEVNAGDVYAHDEKVYNDFIADGWTAARARVVEVLGGVS